MTDMREMTIEAIAENLEPVQEFIAGVLEESDLPMKAQTQIAIAVEEIFVNVAHYAYHPGVGRVVVRINIGPEVTIEFEDGGVPYNPLEKEDPDTTLAAEERNIGGLGVFMVKKLMDTVEYRHVDNKNILTIKKGKE